MECNVMKNPGNFIYLSWISQLKPRNDECRVETTPGSERMWSKIEIKGYFGKGIEPGLTGMWVMFFVLFRITKFYHLLQLGQGWFTLIWANHSYWIASLIASFIQFKSFQSTLFTNPHPALSNSFTGSKGLVWFPFGVELVFTSKGVVGEAWPVVKA